MAEKVVILHGLGSPSWSMAIISACLSRAGYEVVSIAYPSRNMRLSEIVSFVTSQISSRFSGETVHFVGHSLGGHIAKCVAEDCRLGINGRIVMIGTPLRGNVLAKYLGYNVPDLLGYGPIYRDLSPEKHRHHEKAVENYEIGMIAGRIPVLPWFAKLETDGLVGVSSTMAGCLKEHIVVAGSHATLLVSCRVVESCERFLRKGTFVGAES